MAILRKFWLNIALTWASRHCEEYNDRGNLEIASQSLAMTDEMNKLKYEEIKIGDKFQFEKEITGDDVRKFAELTGDFSSLHMDEEYAAKTEFGGRIAHGMLLGSLFSTLVGMMIPGERALYLAQDLKFKNPLKFPGKVFVEGVVVGKSEAAKIIDLKTVIKNSDGIILVEGSAKIKIR